jgi:Tol biopolymer transport system component
MTVAPGPSSLVIAPDGRRAVVVVGSALALPTDLWLVEFERSLVTRLTSSAGSDVAPAWSADGRRLVFRSSRTDNFSFDVFTKEVDGTEDEKPLTSMPIAGLPNDWSRDGRFIVLVRGPDASSNDLFAYSLDSKKAEPLLQTPFSENGARFSNDNRWLAYVSNESGNNEVYVRPFIAGTDGKATLGAKWRVSTSGGTAPRWRADGKELFFRTNGGDFMSVDVTVTGDTIQTTLPKLLFANIPGVHAWDVAPDGKRFLISNLLSSPLAPAAVDPVTVVLNWKTALAK